MSLWNWCFHCWVVLRPGSCHRCPVVSSVSKSPVKYFWNNVQCSEHLLGQQLSSAPMLSKCCDQWAALVTPVSPLCVSAPVLSALWPGPSSPLQQCHTISDQSSSDTTLESCLCTGVINTINSVGAVLAAAGSLHSSVSSPPCCGSVWLVSCSNTESTSAAAASHLN